MMPSESSIFPFLTSTSKPWCARKSAPRSGILVLAKVNFHGYLQPFRCMVLLVVPYVGIGVPLAAVRVSADLLSGNCCWFVLAGMMDMHAPVSTRYLVDDFSSTAQSPVCGVLAVATFAFGDRTASFLTGGYNLGHILLLCYQIFYDSRICHL